MLLVLLCGNCTIVDLDRVDHMFHNSLLFLIISHTGSLVLSNRFLFKMVAASTYQIKVTEKRILSQQLAHNTGEVTLIQTTGFTQSSEELGLYFGQHCSPPLTGAAVLIFWMRFLFPWYSQEFSWLDTCATSCLILYGNNFFYYLFYNFQILLLSSFELQTCCPDCSYKVTWRQHLFCIITVERQMFNTFLLLVSSLSFVMQFVFVYVCVCAYAFFHIPFLLKVMLVIFVV